MRQLSFPGFTKRYVASLSQAGTTAIYPLTREAASENPRLREPLLLYALSNGQEKVLMAAAKNTPLAEAYGSLLQKYDYASMLSSLREQDPTLPQEYRKVWSSYLSVSGKGDRDRRVKALLREKIMQAKQEKGVSTYRICQDIGLNNSNINSWLKNGSDDKVSLDTARRVYDYLQSVVS